MDLGLADRVYIVSGASRGLGFATAQCLVADGARVVIAGRDPERVAGAVAQLRDREPDDRGRAVGVAADLGDPAAADRLVETAVSSFGRLDGALVSVGGPPAGTAAQATDVQWREVFETVFLGAVRLARSVAERLAAHPPPAAGADPTGGPTGVLTGGAIGFVLSSSVRSPLAGLGLSNGIRPGLAGVAKDMADEYAPRGIRVFSLLPHRIMTDRNRDLFAATGDAEAAQAAAEATIPMRRIGEPAEFGRVAAFLLSPAASYLTGLAVPVDGGALRGY